jgi:hypothetical protein
MIDRRKLITAIIAGFVLSATVHAEMMPVSRMDAGRLQTHSVCGPTDQQHADLAGTFQYPSVANLDLWSAGSLPAVDADAAQTSHMQPAQILTGGPDSLSLCLYALMGLGLCGAPHWVKKLHFGHMPEWYHDGGPFQIGHSFAVNPDSICPAPAYCFVQPVFVVEDIRLHYRLGAVVSLWRKSQFTPVAVAPRGPPLS